MTLSNVDLMRLAKHYKVQLHGVYMKDTLRTMVPKANNNYIVNLESTVNENGTMNRGSHWVAIACTKHDCMYFDPFGSPAPKDVQFFILKKYPRFGTNSKEIQALRSVYCGWFDLMFFMYIKKKSIISFYETCNQFTNSFELNRDMNDLVVRKFFREITPKHPIAIDKLHI